MPRDAAARRRAQAGQQSGKRPPEPAATTNLASPMPRALRLLVDLDRRPNVAQGAQPGVPADRDEVVRSDASRATSRASRIAVSSDAAVAARRKRQKVHAGRRAESFSSRLPCQAVRTALEVKEVRLQAAVGSRLRR